MERLKVKISQMDSPYNWEYPDADFVIEEYIVIQTEKQKTIFDEHQFKWSRSVLNLIVAYELSSKLREHARALTHIAWVEQHADDLRAAACSEPLYLAVRSALAHIALATKARILADSDQAKEAEKVSGQVVPLGGGDKERASLLGLKAAMFSRYSLEGHRMALECAREAARLDPDEAEWHFIIGDVLGKIRRVEIGDITADEFAALEKASSIRKDGSFIAELAHLCSEYSSYLYYNKNSKTGRYDWSLSESYGVRAIKLFKEALALRPDCSSTMARVAHGLIRIRHKKLLDMGLVKNLLDRVVELAPHNCMVYHDLGLYYEKYENNTEKAIGFLQIAHKQGNTAAFMYMITLKWRSGRRPEIINDMLHALEEINALRKNEKAEVHVNLGAAYILLENNWDDGLKHLIYSLQEDNSAKYLLAFYGFYGKTTNMLEIIKSQVKKKVRNQTSTLNQHFLTTFLKRCDELHLNPAPSSFTFQEWEQIQLGSTAARKSWNNVSWRS